MRFLHAAKAAIIFVGLIYVFVLLSEDRRADKSLKRSADIYKATGTNLNNDLLDRVSRDARKRFNQN